MQLNIKSVEFPSTLNNTINEKINRHVSLMTSSCNHYTGFRNATKPQQDIFIGKKGEYFVSAYLAHKCGFPVIEPDCTIYSSSNKSWDYDLPYEDTPYHVKTTSYKGELSWVFQWNDNQGQYGRDSVFRHVDTSMVAFVYLEEPESPVGYIKAIIPTHEVIPLLKPPRLEKYQGIKKCLYYNDLVEDDFEPSTNDLLDLICGDLK